MENKSERVLAYTLAKTMDINELSEVSGGGGASQLKMTSRTTLKASGTNGSWDTFLDGVLDW